MYLEEIKMRANGINIWSGCKEMKGLGAALTNPTELSYLKRSVKNLYPVTFRGSVFADAEEAYQAFKSNHLKHDMQLMIEILTAKLFQYPTLFNAIANNGGVAWLEKCQHIVTGNPGSRWEGVGRKSNFILCLIGAFELVSKIKQIDS
jgi:hypothetical protein